MSERDYMAEFNDASSRSRDILIEAGGHINYLRTLLRELLPFLPKDHPWLPGINEQIETLPVDERDATIAALRAACHEKQEAIDSLKAHQAEMRTINDRVHLDAIAALQTRVETELRKVLTLENKVYLKGHWRCAKCDFYQVSTNLYVPSGNMLANDTPQECANGCGPMWRVTHEQSCNTVVDRLEKMQEERNVLRAEAARYKAAHIVALDCAEGLIACATNDEAKQVGALFKAQILEAIEPPPSSIDPDNRCITTPDGGCIADDCMHTDPPQRGETSASPAEDKSIELGMALAQKVFAKRGNHSEMHLSKPELAALLSLAAVSAQEPKK